MATWEKLSRGSRSRAIVTGQMRNATERRRERGETVFTGLPATSRSRVKRSSGSGWLLLCTSDKGGREISYRSSELQSSSERGLVIKIGSAYLPVHAPYLLPGRSISPLRHLAFSNGIHRATIDYSALADNAIQASANFILSFRSRSERRQKLANTARRPAPSAPRPRDAFIFLSWRVSLA